MFTVECSCLHQRIVRLICLINNAKRPELYELDKLHLQLIAIKKIVLEFS